MCDVRTATRREVPDTTCPYCYQKHQELNDLHNHLDKECKIFKNTKGKNVSRPYIKGYKWKW